VLFGLSYHPREQGCPVFKLRVRCSNQEG
jgi:hypothetical protein